MGKNMKWDYETKVKFVKYLLTGRSYNSVCKEFGIKSKGMLANWKRDYLNGDLSKGEPGRPIRSDAEEYEI